MAFYKKQVVTHDTQADIDYRYAYRAAVELMKAERLALYPEITSENVAEVVAWQEARINELTADAAKATIVADKAARAAGRRGSR